MASPAYLARHGRPAVPAALNEHSLLTVSDGAARNWEFTDGDALCRIVTGHALAASGSAMVRLAALAHLGVALLPEPLVAGDLVRGELVALLEGYPVNGGPRGISILYPGRHYLSMKVRSFVDFAVGRYRGADRAAPLRAVA